MQTKLLRAYEISKLVNEVCFSDANIMNRQFSNCGFVSFRKQQEYFIGYKQVNTNYVYPVWVYPCYPPGLFFCFCFLEMPAV